MIDTRDNCLAYIKALPEDSIIEVREIKDNRSKKQNRLYFGYLADIRDYLKDSWMMMTNMALHESFKDTFIEWVHSISILTWKPICERKSTTELNKWEFSQYIKDIQNYLRDSYNIDIPLRTEIQLLINN